MNERNSKRYGIVLIIVLVDILLAIMSCFAVISSVRFIDDMKLNVFFGESHAGQSNISQLFYASDSDSFSSNDVITEVFDDNIVSFDISGIDFKKNIIKFDPFNMKREFSITGLSISSGDTVILNLNGKQLKPYIEKAKGVKAKWTSKSLKCKSKKDDPRILFTRSFSDKIYRYVFLLSKALYCVIAVIIMALGIIQVKLLKNTSVGKEYNTAINSVGTSKNVIGIVCFVIAELLLIVGIAFIYALYYFESHFGLVPFGQLIYHLHTPLDGTDVSSYKNVIIIGVVLTVSIAIISILIYRLLAKRHAQQGYALWVLTVAVILLVCSVHRGIVHFEVVEYYKYTHETTTLYDDHYVDGRDVTLTFPKQKRNLIYIFLESMEVSFSDAASGGGMQENIIPNLTKLALENECFSGDGLLNGAHQVIGATYTMGALAAQTCAVPINESIVSNETLNGSWESENNYLPGVWAIGDVLKNEGYNQEFLIGSKGEFAGRSSYFTGHGGYAVEDYDAAIEEKRIPADYKVWWGYEDEKLFQFAKEDLLKLADQDEPFNFTMLTVDTHFTDGYKCNLCDDKYDSQYSNVIACSDGQTAEFIEWIKGQDFYDNTTIVICGDHLTPDSFYVNAQGLGSFDRRTYAAIINPYDGKEYSGSGRVYTTLDMYPTTLSAMGVKIEGDRLGLGVDLYSNTKTLAEQYGLEYLNTELMKNSDLYTKKLLYK